MKTLKIVLTKGTEKSETSVKSECANNSEIFFTQKFYGAGCKFFCTFDTANPIVTANAVKTDLKFRI